MDTKDKIAWVGVTILITGILAFFVLYLIATGTSNSDMPDYMTTKIDYTPPPLSSQQQTSNIFQNDVLTNMINSNWFLYLMYTLPFFVVGYFIIKQLLGNNY